MLLALAMVTLQLLNRRVLRTPGSPAPGSPRACGTSIAFWGGALVTGRLMGYTFFR